jgi:GABA(A) receptor-associated protein
MERILAKYPDRVPIYVDRKEGSNVEDVERHKYLVPKDMTMGNFIYVLRKNIKLKSNQALFVFVDNIIPPTAELMGTLYDIHKGEDQFMHVTYGVENTFG